MKKKPRLDKSEYEHIGSFPGMSKLQGIVYVALKHWFPSETILVNFRPPWLHGLELDFFLPDRRIGIEVNGAQHKYFAPNFHHTVEGHRAQRDRDNLKRKLCGRVHVSVRKADQHKKKLVLGGLMRALGIVLRRRLALPEPVKIAWRVHVSRLKHKKYPLLKGRPDGTFRPINRAGKNWVNAQNAARTAHTALRVGPGIEVGRTAAPNVRGGYTPTATQTTDNRLAKSSRPADTRKRNWTPRTQDHVSSPSAG